MSLFASGQLNLFGQGANIHFGSNSDGITFNDRITFSVLTTPVIASVVQGPGAGTLADGTYCYRLYYRNNAGTGPASAEVCGAVANGGANSVQINLPRNGGVTILNLCGRTTGAELLMSPGPALNSTVFIDDGSITPSGGSCSGVADTTRGFVDQAATVNLNSSGTAFTANLKAPASMAGTTTLTLPSITGTIPALEASSTLWGGALTGGTLTATPVNLSLGSTYGSSTAGAIGNCKLNIFQDTSTGRYCLGISAGLFEFQATTGTSYGFFINGTKYLNISSTATNVTSGSLQVGGVNVPVSIASGTSAMGTGLITAGTCATVVTTTATGTLTTDSFKWNFNAAPGTGYSAGLHILSYVTAGNVNFLVCNPTAGNLTPAAATLNWQVTR
jgi:hypothetical protein